MKRIYALILTFTMLFALAVMPVSAEEALSDDIVILYTNDIHGYIDGVISYDVVAAIKKDLEKRYSNVFLADAGDHLQGTAYASVDNGKSIIELMNASGYDVAVPGNHEFDYGMDVFNQRTEEAEFSYISSNFYHAKDNVRKENVLYSYVIFDCGKEKLAFVGASTPETIYKTTTAYFEDESQNMIYGFSGGDDGALLQADIQNAINSAKADGATKIIVLGHLGTDLSSGVWTSTETISGLTGLDAFIDGHSHTVAKNEKAKDRNDKSVVLTQTGEHFGRIGIMIIDSESGRVASDFIECKEVSSSDGTKEYILQSSLYDGTEIIYDEEVKKVKDGLIKKIDDTLGQKIARVNVTLDNYDTSGKRLVRMSETNSGDFSADALYWLFDSMDVDFAVSNGGGIRNFAINGDVTYKTFKDMNPFGNVACLIEVTGQQMKDALEWGARKVGQGESGSFLQVSGITYKIDTTIPDTEKTDENHNWAASPEGDYRVYDVKVYNRKTNTWEAIDTEKTYRLAGYNYNLRKLGDGYNMFKNCNVVADHVMEDYLVLSNYAKSFENAVVDAVNSPINQKYPGFGIDYSSVAGNGRIVIGKAPLEKAHEPEIIVGGVKITKDNASDVLGDGGSVKYSFSTSTLTLTDADIHSKQGDGIYVYDVDNLNIVGIDTQASGDNSISGRAIVAEEVDKDGNAYSRIIGGAGIFADGSGNSGSVTLKGSFGNITGDNSHGIIACEDVSIDATINEILAAGSASAGIRSDYGNITIEKNAQIHSITSPEDNGISAEGNVYVYGNLGTVSGNYAGIYTTGGNVKISGRIKTVSGNTTGIEAYPVTETDHSGTQVKKGGSVYISGIIGLVSADNFGIYAGANLDISGSFVVNATGDGRHAIYSGGNIVLSEGVVLSPEEYCIVTLVDETVKDETGAHETCYNTIAHKDSTPAKEVVFGGWQNPYIDVNADLWYYDDVRFATEKGLFMGTSENTFSPEINLTRAMLVTVLYRYEGGPSVNGEEYSTLPMFEDVSDGAYYADAVLWAKNNGIVSGTTDTLFAPDLNITREQIAAIMYRYAQYKGFDVSCEDKTVLNNYTDRESISDYALSSVVYMVNMGYMTGKTANTLNPCDNATRAEGASILRRVVGR